MKQSESLAVVSWWYHGHDGILLVFSIFVQWVFRIFQGSIGHTWHTKTGNGVLYDCRSHINLEYQQK
jgi:hypothetical protein